MRILQLIFILIMIVFINDSSLYAQRLNKGKKVQGFVINNKQDTIHGLIKIEDYELAEIRVKFTERRGKNYLKEKTYKPKDIAGYAVKVPINNNSTQITETWIPYERKEALEPPRPFASTSVFMERKEEGQLKLFSYYIRSNSSANLLQCFFLQKSHSKELIKVTPENFEEVTDKYLTKCKFLKNRLGRADFSYLNFAKIIHIYNNCNTEASPDEH